MSYTVYALLAALAASLGTIFAKIGLKDVDANLLTALRGIVMALIVTLAALSFGKLTGEGMSSLSGKQWLFIILSGAGGALSWILFYHALSAGPVVTVTVIDKLSILFTAVLAFIILAERVSLQAFIGLICIGLGSLLVALPIDKLLAFFK